MVADAFNPQVALPSYDCRTDPATKACVSVSGTLAGEAIDRHCAGTVSPGAVFRTPDAFPVACLESGSPRMGFWYQVTVPVQGAGAFSYDLTPDGAFLGANVTVARDGSGGEVRSDHFVGGKLSGTLVKDASDDDLISGTFRMTWGAPGVSCQPGGPSGCAAADVNGTFRVLNVLDVD